MFLNERPNRSQSLIIGQNVNFFQVFWLWLQNRTVEMAKNRFVQRPYKNLLNKKIYLKLYNRASILPSLLMTADRLIPTGKLWLHRKKSHVLLLCNLLTVVPHKIQLKINAETQLPYSQPV